MTIHLHHGDLPAGLDLGKEIAIDTEAMGLVIHRDRLCLIQMSAGDGVSHLVQIPALKIGEVHQAPNLTRLLTDPDVTKIFHFARFDLAAMHHWLGIVCAPVYCTKIASKLVRTYTDRHGLKDLCREILGIDLSKHQQSSDWGALDLSPEQLKYAASDVLHLHQLKAHFDAILKREGRWDLAQACFRFLPHRAALDLLGWAEPDIFSH